MDTLSAVEFWFNQLAAATLEQPPALPSLPDNLADAASSAFDNSPQLRAAQYGEEAARHGISVARGAMRPEVSLRASASAARDSSFSGDENDHKICHSYTISS